MLDNTNDQKRMFKIGDQVRIEDDRVFAGVEKKDPKLDKSKVYTVLDIGYGMSGQQKVKIESFGDFKFSSRFILANPIEPCFFS